MQQSNERSDIHMFVICLINAAFLLYIMIKMVKIERMLSRSNKKRSDKMNFISKQYADLITFLQLYLKEHK